MSAFRFRRNSSPWLLCLVGAIVAGCSHGSEEAPTASPAVSEEPTAVPVRVGHVEPRPVQRMVTSVGTLNGFEEIMLTPEVEGRVVRIYHDIGDRVKPGDPLVEIDPTNFELLVAEARRSLDLELARLGVRELPCDDFDVHTLPSVARAEHMLTNATRRKDRVKSLRDRNVSTEEEWDQAQTDFHVAEANLRQTVLEAEATLAAAKQRQAALESAQEKLADTRIVAPPFPQLDSKDAKSPDYVVAERLVSEGEMVRAFPSTAVMKLVMDNPLKLAAPIAERYMGEVKVEQPVKLKVDAYGDEIFDGRVSRINPTVDPNSHTFQIEAFVDNSDARLKAGAFAKLAVLTRIDPAALTVPLEALITFAGVRKVFVVRDDAAYGVEVKPGVRGTGWLEVTGDLKVGDVVVTSGYSKLADGTPVRILEGEAATVAERPAP